MKQTAVAFRAKARTIDHLGKGQIADCPTAVSELWKNAYDAYARDVALHTFDGPYKTGVVMDNGCGMTMQQLIDSWLVIGTEAKSKKKLLPEVDRFNLPARQTQGEKGIGRLSSAFLAPVTLLVTKKIDGAFAAALVDWRLFENTYLSIDDIKIPLVELSDLSQILGEFGKLVDQIKANLCIANKGETLSESQKATRDHWVRYSKDEMELAKAHKKEVITTEARISGFCDGFKFNPKMLDSWIPFLNRVEGLDGDTHGTALFLLDLDRDLSLITNPGSLANDNQELTTIKADLIDTLRAFVDPYSQSETDFFYEIKTFSTAGIAKELMRQTDVFDRDSFLALEHTVVGSVDARGWFAGRVKAFGKDMGEIKFAPSIEIDKTGTKVGGFDISLGTFEFELIKTSHTESEHSNLVQQAEKYSGLLIFRDGLRVLPYGRVENDFFEIEEKRSTNAGRYYWSKRRMFGQILITSADNSALKDKAGREGFIKNQAARELKSLVASILDNLADRFFGGKSDGRKTMLALVKAEKEARKEAQLKAKRVTQKSFLEELKQKSPELIKRLKEIKMLDERLNQVANLNQEDIEEINKQLVSLEQLRGELKTPVKPPKLGDNEDKYRAHRDLYNEFNAFLVKTKSEIAKHESILNAQSPVQSAKRYLERNQAALNGQVNKFGLAISAQLSVLQGLWNDSAATDRSKFYAQAIEILRGVENGADLEGSLNALDALQSNLACCRRPKTEPLIEVVPTQN